MRFTIHLIALAVIAIVATLPAYAQTQTGRAYQICVDNCGKIAIEQMKMREYQKQCGTEEGSENETCEELKRRAYQASVVLGDLKKCLEICRDAVE